MRLRRNRLWGGFASLSICFAFTAAAAAPPDYSKEGSIIEEFRKEAAFADDGTSVSETQAAIRIQSDAGARQYGVLAFYYDRDNSKVDIEYVRVRKPDGAVVATPLDSVQDLTTEVTRLAPTYSDLREKQLPVKGLSPGDVLEYRVRFTQTKPDVPGEFWGADNFLTGAVVLNETLQISVPASKYVKVVSQSVQPQITEKNGHKIYFWKTSQLKPTSGKQDTDTKPKLPDVQFTTFRSWADVGHWYGQLVAERAVVTPAIQAKANEITKGLTSVDEKRKAIYNYVSTQFRYISLSFGIGRYQPHFADEVLSNKYGDCKDKHTLFAALLKAAGIEAWPALMGEGINFDPEVPSPAQFNHVISVLPTSKGLLWPDTTPEVAPFGLLYQTLRDKQALVIPGSGAAYVTKTPADPPFPASQVLSVDASLAADGTLKGHFDFTMHGDMGLIFRVAFHNVPRANWQQLVQNIVNSFGFAGTVSNVAVENPEDLEKPLHFSYDYLRKNYSDWKDHRITPPLFPIALPLMGSDTNPDEPIFIHAPGSLEYHATVRLPNDYTAKLPAAVNVQENFAAYHASYAAAHGVLSASGKS